MSFYNTNVGYIYNYSNEIYKTTNSGLNFTLVTTVGTSISDLKAVGNNKFLINLNYSSVAQSHDDGSTILSTNMPSGNLISTSGNNLFDQTTGYFVVANWSSSINTVYRYNTSTPTGTSSTTGMSTYQLQPQNALSSCTQTDLVVALNVSSATSGIIGQDFEIPFDATKFYVKTVTAGNLLINTNDISINTIAGVPAKLFIGVSTSSLTGSGSMLLGNSGNVLNVTLGTIGLLTNGNYSFSGSNAIESFVTTSAGLMIMGYSVIVSSSGTNLLAGNIYLVNSSISLPNTLNAYNNIVEMTNCSSNLGYFQQNGANSSFSFAPTINSNSLSVSRTINSVAGVSGFINSTDAIAVTSIRQGVNPYQNPTLHQLLAADVNSDGAVTSGDRTQILRRSVLNLPSFALIPSAKDWKFYKKGMSYTFSKDNVPVISNCMTFTSTGTTCISYENLSIVGVLTGDVNANYTVSANGSNFRTDSNGDLVFDLSNEVINGIQIVPVFLSNNVSGNGIDFTLDYLQANGIKIKGIVLNNSSLDEASYNDSNNDKLYFSGILKAKNEEPILSIEFETTAKLKESDFDVSSTIALSNDERVSATLRTEKVTLIATEQSKTNVTVFPNPTADGSIEISTNKEAFSYSITNMLGQVLLVGKSSSSRTRLQGLSGGMYILKVEEVIQKIIVY